MELTREQAIAEHRKMWNWIADETLQEGYKARKDHYLKENGFEGAPVANDCFCCEYVLHSYMELLRNTDIFHICSLCPIDWGDNTKCTHSLYDLWVCSDNLKEAAKLARQIANLPERTDNIPADK